MELGDFHPILYCNVMYKIISKILANKLKRVVGGLVSQNQSAFIKGQQITDNILLAHEQVRGFNRSRGFKRACLKVDLKKVYDSVNKSF